MKVAAIVPALNEEKNIAKVLKALLESKDINEVIAIDDGSTDRTAEVSRETGAKVISLPKKGGSGKGNAMREGIKSTDADVIVFFDADLIGLTPEHASLLVRPILKEGVAMCVGMRERRRRWKGAISEFMIKVDPLSAIAGERAIRRYIFEAIPSDFIQGFMVETALNYYCLANKLKVKYVKLRGLDIIVKEKKWGLVKGLKSRIRMMWQLLKIRVLIFQRRKEFKKNVL